MVNYPWAPGYPGYRKNTSQDIARQTATTYEDYQKIKGFEDVGYFLQYYVVSGGVVTKNVTHNNQLDISDTVVSLQNDIMHRDAVSGWQLTEASSVYYVDFYEGDYWVNTAHPEGTAEVDYLTLATVSTDDNGNVNDIIDMRGEVGGFKLKNSIDFRIPYYDEELANLAPLENQPNYYYVPRTMEATNGSGEINAATIKSADVYALYDALMAKYPNYITQVLLGNDESGTFPIYKYEFTPEKYKYSMVLGSAIHGPGTGGDPKDTAVALYLFMRDICENWKHDKALSRLRWDAKFHVIPVQNPWGFDNDRRQNSNGVDLNRNFDYAWSSYTPTENYPFGHDYKGTSAFSEIETRHIRDVLLSVPDTSAYIDFHAWMNTDIPFKYVFAGGPTSPLTGIGENVSLYLSEKYNVERTIELYSNMPQGFQYSWHVLGIPGCNPEFTVFTNDLPIRGSEAATRMVEWYGNIVYAFALYAEPSRYRGALVQFNPTSPLNIPDTGNTKINLFSVIHDSGGFWSAPTSEFVIPPGIKVINISGQVNLKSASASPQTVTITVLIRKNGGRYAGYGVSKQTISLGGATDNLKEYSMGVNSISVPVVPGDKFTLEVAQTGGATNINVNPDVREGTWFAIEAIKTGST